MNRKEKASWLRQTGLWLPVGLFLLAFGLRVLALDNFPPGLRYDELQNHLMANRVLEGERPLYFAESWGHEPLYHYAQATILSLLGQTDWTLRIVSVYLGVLTVAAVGLVANNLFGRRVTIVAVAVTAVAFWSVFYSRIGLRVGATTFFITLTVYFLWQIWTRPPTQKRTGYLIAASGGLFMAAGPYIYQAGRIGFGIWLGFIIYAAIFHFQQLKRTWKRFLIMGLVGIVLIIPLIWTLQQSPGLEQRLDLLNEPLESLKAGNPGQVLGLTLKALGMYFVQGEQDWLYNVSGRPIFDIVTAIFFLLGVGLSIYRWRRPEFALVLIWLFAGTFPAMLAPPEASLTHTIAAQPAAFILFSVGTGYSWQILQRYRARLAVVLAGALVLFYGLLSFNAYFFTWNQNPETKELYQGGITAVADRITASPPSGPIAIGAPFINYWHPWNMVNFDLAMPTDTSQVRWFNPAGGWVWPAADKATTYFFPNDPLGKQIYDPTLFRLFEADATSGPETHEDYLTYQVVEPFELETLLNQLEGQTELTYPPDISQPTQPAVPLSFGGHLDLIAVDEPDTAVAAGDTLQFLTFWRVRQPYSAPLVAFSHLTDEKQDIWGQQDWLDVRIESLQAGDHFAQVHTITVNPETPPGEYFLLMGLYGPDTLVRLPIVPTGADRVQVGTVIVTDGE